MHLLINPTWSCQNKCEYCWVRETVLKRGDDTKKVRPAGDWIRAINKNMPEMVEVCGGEPFLYKDIGRIVDGCPTTRFAFTTNLRTTDAISRFVLSPHPNVIGITASFHPDVMDEDPDYVSVFAKNMSKLLQAGYRPSVNIIDYEDNLDKTAALRVAMAKSGLNVITSPFEQTDADYLKDKLEDGLSCLAGVAHMVIAPDGTAWPCLTSLRSPYEEDYRLGNWLDDDIDLSKKEQPCYLKCVDYYVLTEKHSAGDMWGVCARPA